MTTNKKITFPFYCKDRSGVYHKITSDYKRWRISLFKRGNSMEYAIMVHKGQKNLIEEFIQYCDYKKITEKQWLLAIGKVMKLLADGSGIIEN